MQRVAGLPSIELPLISRPMAGRMLYRACVILLKGIFNWPTSSDRILMHFTANKDVKTLIVLTGISNRGDREWFVAILEYYCGISDFYVLENCCRTKIAFLDNCDASAVGSSAEQYSCSRL
jgi:hypothetical protein